MPRGWVTRAEVEELYLLRYDRAVADAYDQWDDGKEAKALWDKVAELRTSIKAWRASTELSRSVR